jgi:hypothetical protein
VSWRGRGGGQTVECFGPGIFRPGDGLFAAGMPARQSRVGRRRPAAGADVAGTLVENAVFFLEIVHAPAAARCVHGRPAPSPGAAAAKKSRGNAEISACFRLHYSALTLRRP